MDYWNHVLCSDDSKINLFRSDGAKHVWRLSQWRREDSVAEKSLLQEVNTQRETKQELFVGRGGAFRRQNGAFRRAEAELSVGRNGAFRRAEAELSVGRNGAFRRAEAGSAGKQWAAKGPAIGVQEAAGLRNRGTRTDRKRRPQTLQGSDKRESVTGTDIAQWWWLSAGAN